MTDDNADNNEIIKQLKRIADALETLSAPPAITADFQSSRYWRWEATERGGNLSPLIAPPLEDIRLLHGVDNQIKLIDNNTRSFIHNRPSNHVLLTGPRGTGKSSVARGIFYRHINRLRLIETDVEGLAKLPLLLPTLAANKRDNTDKFIIYCDDLSFGDSGGKVFQRLKSILDGSLATVANYARVYATSNRRRLIAENFADNLTKFNSDEIHGGETIEEKISLSDRFGLWVPFFDLSLEQYETIVSSWLRFYGVKVTAKKLMQARQWADERGARNGRLARHFAAAVANKTA